MFFLLGSSLGVRSPPSFGAGDLAHRFSASGSLRPPGGQPTLTAEIAFRLMRRLEANDRPPRRASGQTRSRTAFLRRLRCGFSVVLRREQHDLAVEIKRQAGIPPRTWTPSSLRFFIQSLLRRVTLCFPAVLQALPPLHEDRGQGRHGLLSLSVPFAYATRPLKVARSLPLGAARYQTCFLF